MVCGFNTAYQYHLRSGRNPYQLEKQMNEPKRVPKLVQIAYGKRGLFALDCDGQLWFLDIDGWKRVAVQLAEDH